MSTLITINEKEWEFFKEGNGAVIPAQPGPQFQDTCSKEEARF